MILGSNIFMACSFVLEHEITITNCPLMVEDLSFNTVWLWLDTFQNQHSN